MIRTQVFMSRVPWATLAMALLLAMTPRFPAQVSPGLELELSIPKPLVKAGEPVMCTLRIHNRSTVSLKYDPQDFFAFRVLRAVDAKGQPDLSMGFSAQTMGGDIDLLPGASAELWKDADLGQLYLLAEGTYRVFAEKSDRRKEKSLRSNEVALTIRGGTLPYFKGVSRQVRAALPENWRMSVSSESLTLLHSTTNLKKDIVAITMWSTARELPKDIHRGTEDDPHEIRTLGKANGGLLHLRIPRSAARVWPEAGVILPKLMLP
ncbi:MAG TPA: hypothetical protein PKA37_10190 [Planctomycetota bacterium]|nr:hypothetical protein [Planctomycetota bacterium]